MKTEIKLHEIGHVEKYMKYVFREMKEAIEENKHPLDPAIEELSKDVFIYTTHSGKGKYTFDFKKSRVYFEGYRNSFISGTSLFIFEWDTALVTGRNVVLHFAPGYPYPNVTIHGKVVSVETSAPEKPITQDEEYSFVWIHQINDEGDCFLTRIKSVDELGETPLCEPTKTNREYIFDDRNDMVLLTTENGEIKIIAGGIEYDLIEHGD